MKPDDPRHGTYAGAQRHMRDGEYACEACRQAKRDYLRTWRKKTGDKANRRREAARSRARIRLAHLHPDLFAALVSEELRRDREGQR